MKKKKKEEEEEDNNSSQKDKGGMDETKRMVLANSSPQKVASDFFGYAGIAYLYQNNNFYRNISRLPAST